MNEKEMISKYYELERQGKREEGIGFLEEYIRTAGDNVSAELLSRTGDLILLYLGELEKGIKYFHRAIAKEPENPDIYWRYFTDLDEITDKFPETIDDAILCLTKIIEYSRNFEFVKTFDGTADNWDEKKKRYNYDGYIEDNLKREVNIARRYRDLSVIYMKIPDYEKAEECIDKTLAVLPEDEYAILTKNKILVATGREREIVCLADDNVIEQEIKLDETITDPLLILEELVHKISYNGYRAPIPEEWMKKLNDLTGNGWTEEEYKEFCVEYECRSTLEETVYALLHNGEYPDNIDQDIYFWKSNTEVDLSEKQIMFKLRKLPETVDENVVCCFDDLPIREFCEWFCTYYSYQRVDKELSEEEIQSGTFRVCFFCEDIAYATYKYVTLRVYGNKLISLDCCNLLENEKQEILAFASKHQLHVFED